MQVKKLQSKTEAFKPFDLVISVESAEEARALYAIFNHTDNVKLLKEDQAHDINGTIGREFYTEGVIANGITWEDFYWPKGQKS